jgi:hypothetical protein
MSHYLSRFVSFIPKSDVLYIVALAPDTTSCYLSNMVSEPG